MENVPQQTLKYIVKKYFQLFRDKDYIDDEVLLIKTMNTDLGPRHGSAIFGIYKDGEIIKAFGAERETLSFEKDKDTFLENENTIILSIDLKFQLKMGALVGHRVPFSLKIYRDGVLSVYPGENCSDKNRITSLELLMDNVGIMFKHNSTMECVNIIEGIIVRKEDITKNLIKIKKIKESDLPETNALNDSIVQLALRYKDSQDPTMMKRSRSRSLRKLKEVNYNQFGATDLDSLRKFYIANAKEIIAMDTGVPFIDIIKKPIYLESCDSVSNLIRDLERVKENMEKALETADLILNEKMDKNYQTEPKNYDNPEEFQKEKKRGILALKQYLELNGRQYDDLVKETELAKRHIKLNRRGTGKYLKNITARVHTTVPFAFGKSSVIDSELVYLQKFL
jgi:hypothetical protein